MRTYSKVESGEVVMEEKLSRHEEEGEIVKEPSKNEESTESVIKHDGSCLIQRKKAWR